MKLTQIVGLVNTKLAGETLTYNQMLSYLDETIIDINTQLNACFPTFSETHPNLVSDATYNAFPDQYITSVVVIGAALKFYTTDEEGISVATGFQQEYDRGLFYMVRDYSASVPEQYQAKNRGYIEGSAPSSGLDMPYYKPGCGFPINPDLRIIEGPRGLTGPQGPEGKQGPQGPEGKQGPIGPEGKQGPIGPQGPEGKQGPQGERGNKGDKGDKGDAGKDATPTLIVTVTGTFSSTSTLDLGMSYGEFKAIMDSGQEVVLKHDNQYYYLLQHTASYSLFVTAFDMYNNRVRLMDIEYDMEDIWGYSPEIESRTYKAKTLSGHYISSDDYYPSTKAVADYVDAKTGDIGTALDNIIAIQNSLIGGDGV